MSGIVAILSFRLGGIDGVSRESDKYDNAWRALGWKTVNVAGAGPVDRVVPGLNIDAAAPPRAGEVADAVADADVVHVMNLCSLPLNPRAADAVASALRGRPAIMHHFDLPWQRERFAGWPPPPDDPAWAHVTINRRSAGELAERAGIEATTIYNAFDADPALVARHEARNALGLVPTGRIVLQPTRAIARKNVRIGLELAASIGALYWLTGPVEEGYGPTLDSILSQARGCPGVLHQPVDDVAVAYGACDVVAFPSTVEGFGNPVIESAVYRRPLAVGAYPVLDELRAFGFEWLSVNEPDAVAAKLADIEAGDTSMLDRNHQLAREHFSLAALPDRLRQLLSTRGWTS